MKKRPSALKPEPVPHSRLSDEDLLARVLALSARRSEAALNLARRVLDACGGLRGLAEASDAQLRQVRGLDTARIQRIRAALEMSQRAQEHRLDIGGSIRHPADAARTVLARHGQPGKEVFGILLLDVRNRPRNYKIVSVGTMDQSLVHPREVFRDAVTEGAAKVILFHNHPSGDPSPSPEDVEITRRLVKVGETLGIPVLDHLILGEGTSYVSLKERALI